MKNNDKQTATEMMFFRQKAEDYLLCYNDNCALAASCLRRKVAHFGNSNYYRYRNGEYLISPDVRNVIEKVCRQHGWTGELTFDDAVLDYEW
jgi:hypothetical protein